MKTGRGSGPPPIVSSAASNSASVWRDPALLAIHQARSAAAAGKIPPHLGLHPAAAATMADHHRHPGAAGSAQPPSSSVISAASAQAQFSALQHHYQVTVL